MADVCFICSFFMLSTPDALIFSCLIAFIFFSFSVIGPFISSLTVKVFILCVLLLGL